MATPPVKVSVPSKVGPLKNWTVPVGVPTPGLTAAIVAVSVTDWPETGKTGEKVTVVVVDAWVTVTVTAVEVLVVKLLSPSVLDAVIELLATGSELVVEGGHAAAQESRCPIEVVPLRNSTVPVGVPAPGLTAAIVAVNVTDWP